MNSLKSCFVVMPFRAELNFFYLYFKTHLEKQHGLIVDRGDTTILTKALLDKIEAQIQAADFIVGDVTYSNPNVFYELGFARAIKKPTIFLTQEDPEKMPVDLRQFEFIKYDLSRDVDFISKLDNAISNLVGADYRPVYESALKMLASFNVQMKTAYGAVSFEEFHARVRRSGGDGAIPDGDLLKEFLLPKIISEATDISAIRKIDKWVSIAAGSSRRRRQL